MASEFDWYKINFLESTANIKGVLGRSVGREPSTKIAKEITLCLQQGRLFYEAAARAPLQIKPLLIFYGILGFSKALIVARNFRKLETLDQRHGVKDTSRQNATLQELQVKVLDKGTFQLFNDTVCQFDRIHFFKASMPTTIIIPTSKSDLLAQKTITLKEILARTPRLESLYRSTFGEDAKVISCQLNYHEEYDGHTELRIDDPEVFANREALIGLVGKWRKRFPFLNNWCLIQASPAWGNSVLIFANIEKTNIDEFSEDFLSGTERGYVAEKGMGHRRDYGRRTFGEILGPIAGGVGGFGSYMTEVFDNAHICESSLHYLGMYLLSSLVRYRPQIWQHSISRLGTSESPADDKALSLIERFMDVCLSVFPQVIVDAMDVQL